LLAAATVAETPTIAASTTAETMATTWGQRGSRLLAAGGSAAAGSGADGPGAGAFATGAAGACTSAAASVVSPPTAGTAGFPPMDLIVTFVGAGVEGARWP